MNYNLSNRNYSTTISKVRINFERKKGELYLLQKKLEETLQTIIEQGIALTRHEKALEIVKEVGLKTQQQLSVHISDITTLAMEAVFENPYKLEVEFLERRNKTECDLYFMRNGDKISPLEASGGGAVDVAAFALRIASWSMQKPKSRNTIILDEPMRFLSSGYQLTASKMIKEISERMGIQFIIITHEPELASYADRTFEVSIKKGISNVTEN